MVGDPFYFVFLIVMSFVVFLVYWCVLLFMCFYCLCFLHVLFHLFIYFNLFVFVFFFTLFIFYFFSGWSGRLKAIHAALIAYLKPAAVMSSDHTKKHECQIHEH